MKLTRTPGIALVCFYSAVSYHLVCCFVQNRARFCPKTCHAEEVTEPICFKFAQDVATYISLHPPKSYPHYLQNNLVVNPNVEATLKKHFAVF